MKPTPPVSHSVSLCRSILASICAASLFLSVSCSKKGEELFTDDLSNATFPPGTWTIKDGILKGNGKGGLMWTKKEYTNFQLDVDFRIPPNNKANSGIFLRCPNPEKAARNRSHHHQNSIELEIITESKPKPKNGAGALLTICSPQPPLILKPNQWYHYSVKAVDSMITVSCDGKQLYSLDLSKGTKAGKNPDGSPNILKVAMKDLPKKGHIGFQDFLGPVEFKNVLITEL